jgi:hypothetical protein
MCYVSVLSILRNLGDGCHTLGIEAMKNFRFWNYDNCNIKTSEHVEQRDDGPLKVTSGTFAVGFTPFTLDPQGVQPVQIQPIIERLLQCNGLSPQDL